MYIILLICFLMQLNFELQMYLKNTLHLIFINVSYISPKHIPYYLQINVFQMLMAVVRFHTFRIMMFDYHNYLVIRPLFSQENHLMKLCQVFVSLQGECVAEGKNNERSPGVSELVLWYILWHKKLSTYLVQFSQGKGKVMVDNK